LGAALRGRSEVHKDKNRKRKWQSSVISEKNQRHLGGKRSHIDLVCITSQQDAKKQPDPCHSILDIHHAANCSNNLSSRRAIVEPAGSLDGLLLGNSNDIDGDRIETKALEEILCLAVDLELSGLALAEVESRNLGDVLILSLTLLFLELEGDTTDGTTLDTLHQMCGVTSNLVAESL